MTFAKRKKGLFKKAYELSELCQADVTILVKDEHGNKLAFSSCKNQFREQLKLFDDCTDIQGAADFATEESDDNNILSHPMDSTVGKSSMSLPKQCDLGDTLFGSQNFDNINFKRLEERFAQNGATSLQKKNRPKLELDFGIDNNSWDLMNSPMFKLA